MSWPGLFGLRENRGNKLEYRFIDIDPVFFRHSICCESVLNARVRTEKKGTGEAVDAFP